jgi:hypothetical protein
MLFSGDIYLRAFYEVVYIVYLLMATTTVRTLMFPMCFTALKTPRVFIHNDGAWNFYVFENIFVPLNEITYSLYWIAIFI